jgi:MATE family multidrug resistance protein
LKIRAPTKEPTHSTAEELRQLSTFALPISAGYLLSYVCQVTSIFFIGHLGSLELAAACLALTYANVIAFSVGVGLATGMDTLCAASFSGRTDDPTAVGRVMQQALLVMLIASLPIWHFYGSLPRPSCPFSAKTLPSSI